MRETSEQHKVHNPSIIGDCNIGELLCYYYCRQSFRLHRFPIKLTSSLSKPVLQSTTHMDSEIRDLRKKISLLKNECEILEKANRTSAVVADMMRKEVKRLEELLSAERNSGASQQKKSGTRR